MAGHTAPTGAARPDGEEGDTGVLDAVFEALDLPVLAVSSGRAELVANPAARAVFALPATGALEVDRLGQVAGRLQAVEGAVEVDADRLPLLRALSGDPVDEEFVLVVPGAEPRRLLLRGRPLLGADGAVGGAVCGVHDLALLAHRHAVLARRSAGIAAVSRATRAVLAGQDARQAVCDAARDLCGALAAVLLEPDGGGALRVSAQAGTVGTSVGLGPAGATLARSVRQARRPLVLPDARAVLDVRIGAALVAGSGPARLAAALGMARATPSGSPQVVLLPVGATQPARAVLAVVTGGPGLVDQMPVLEVLAGEFAAAIEQQDLMRRLRREAGSDSLTGAATRRVWHERMPQALRAARAGSMPLAVVMLDLDHFKRFNDTRGHLAGDALLRAAVQAWQARLRPGDLLCRYGGEEFLVLAPGRGEAQARALAEALRAAMPAHQTCSAGVAVWDGRESPDSLVGRADAALYAAKVAGRDQVRLAG